MKFSRSPASWLVLLSLCAGTLWLSAQNSTMSRPIRKKDLIPLSYPQASIGVGTMRWSERARDEARSFKAPELTFSKAFRESIRPQAIEWEDFEKQRSFKINLSAAPGPQVLEAAKLASGKASVGFDHKSLRFVKWGDLKEATVDLQDLTEACLRGWFNLPGRSMRSEVLFQMELDEKKSNRRPWIVTRVIRTEGLEYQLNKETDGQFDLNASHAAYGAGSLGLAFSVKNKSTLVINEPMAIAFDAVQLETVEPPLPRLKDLVGEGAVHPTNHFGTFKFTWRYGEGGDRETITIRTGDLWIRDAWAAQQGPADEEQYPTAQKEALEKELKAGKPVPAAVIPEVLAAGAKEWKPLGEGDAFPGDGLLRLRVILEEPGYLYVLARDGAGQSAVMYPAAPGQPLAKGKDAQVPKGAWVYPTDVDGSAGMKFDPRDPPGVESFIVVASRTQLPQLPSAMAEFARAGNQTPRPTSPTRGGFAFTGLLRLPVGFAGGTAAASSDTNNVPAIFSGLNSATVLTVTLNRQSVLPKREEPRAGLKLPNSTSATLDTAAAGSASEARVVNVMDYYPTLPAGAYQRIWGVFAGVSEYADPSVGGLENPASDATQLAAAFVQRTGMQPPIVLTNGQATLEGLRAALREVGSKDGPGDLFVFHFSGHGVGLDNQSGRMLLHEFNPQPDRDATGSSGMLEMRLLTQLLDESGVDSKHRLLVLDCCYSGMGARPVTRGAMTRGLRGPSAEERRQNMLQSLGLKTTYVLTAGGAGQPVLDGGDGSGARHGLLSGFLIEALAGAPATKAPAGAALGDRWMVPVRDLFREGKDQIRVEARRVMTGEFSQWKNAPTRQVVLHRSRDGGTLDQIFGRVQSPSELDKLVQNPQDAVVEGEGEVFLPLLGQAGGAVPTGPTDPDIERPEKPKIEEPKTGTKAFREWAMAVGKRYNNSAYAKALEAVFQPLVEGLPPAKAGQPLSVTAELQMRPRLDTEQFADVFSRERLAAKYPVLANDPDSYTNLFNLELEGWRERTRGANWNGLPYHGGITSPNYEVGFLIENRGTEPLNYCLVAHDAYGILQWIAPINGTEPEPGYTFGPEQLQPQARLRLPDDLIAGNGRVTQGWPIEFEADQQFFLIVTRQPWTELTNALTAASKLGFAQYRQLEQMRAGGASPAPIGAELPRPTAGVRAVGKVVQSAPKPKEDPAARSRPEAPEVLTRAEGNCLVFAWHLQVLPANRLRPELAKASD